MVGKVKSIVSRYPKQENGKVFEVKKVSKQGEKNPTETQ